MTQPKHNAPDVFGGLMTVREVCETLALARSTVYELMDKGQLPYVKLGGARRVPRQAVANLIKANLKGGWAL